MAKLSQIKYARGLIAAGIGLFILAFGFQNCSDVRLTRQAEPAIVLQNDGSFKVVPDSFVRYNKVLFVVDKSGSNKASGGPGGSGPGNDPDNNKRAGSMELFLEQKKDDPYYKWGYVVFVNSQAEPWITEGDSKLGKFGTAEDMAKALQKQRSVGDVGCTPYMAALNMAKVIIEKDIEDHPDEQSLYNVFFMSDGYPNDAIVGPGCGNELRAIKDAPDDPYLMTVDSLRKVAPDRIYLSTAYYTEKVNDPSRLAGDGLNAMARRGGGKFVDLQGDGVIKFDEIQIGNKPIPLKIKQMFAINLNAGFCDDGTVGSDSDTDGICDKDEVDYNKIYERKLAELGKTFSPTNRNSLSPDYMDSMSYRQLLLPSGQGLRNCNNNKPDQDFDLLNKCEEYMMSDINRNGPTTQWTMAMLQSGAEPGNPDSDGDGFLDGLEWLVFQSFSAAVNHDSLSHNTFPNGMKGDQIIREHRHPRNPSVFGPDQYDGNLVSLGIDPEDGSYLYRYDQSKLALYPTQAVTSAQVSGLSYLAHAADENIVLVYYIAVPENDESGRGFLYYSFQKFNYHDASTNIGLKFKDFPVYKIPKLVSAE